MWQKTAIVKHEGLNLNYILLFKVSLNKIDTSNPSNNFLKSPSNPLSEERFFEKQLFNYIEIQDGYSESEEDIFVKMKDDFTKEPISILEN